jgi:hypothetical protein
MVTVKVGATGSIDLVTNQGCPHVIVDVAGYYRGGVVTAGGFVGLTPVRALDTRNDGPCVASVGRSVTIAGRFGVPQSTNAGLPGSNAVALNVTVTGGTSGGFLTMWPARQAQPVASNINFVAGQTIANMVVVRLGSNGAISLMTNQGCPDVVVDIAGYFTLPEN